MYIVDNTMYIVHVGKSLGGWKWRWSGRGGGGRVQMHRWVQVSGSAGECKCR